MSGFCPGCGISGQLVEHHVASGALAPTAVVWLCPKCHSQLHAGYSRLWRGQAEGVEAVRLGLLRLGETLDYLNNGPLGSGPSGDVLSATSSALDDMAARLLPSEACR